MSQIERTTFRLSQHDRHLADVIAFQLGLDSMSAVVRHLLRKTARELGLDGGEPGPITPKRGRPKKAGK